MIEPPNVVATNVKSGTTVVMATEYEAPLVALPPTVVVTPSGVVVVTFPFSTVVIVPSAAMVVIVPSLMVVDEPSPFVVAIALPLMLVVEVLSLIHI